MRGNKRPVYPARKREMKQFPAPPGTLTGYRRRLAKKSPTYHRVYVDEEGRFVVGKKHKPSTMTRYRRQSDIFFDEQKKHFELRKQGKGRIRPRERALRALLLSNPIQFTLKDGSKVQILRHGFADVFKGIETKKPNLNH